MDKKELATRTHMSVRGIEALMKRRKIPYVRMGYRTIRFSWPKVEQALSKLTVESV